LGKTKKFSAQEAAEKIRRYCAYQERSHREVREKLFEYGLYERDVNEILTGLITDGYLNEERFARAYAGGKFRMKKWGRVKITRGLEAKGVSKNCIKIGLKEIDEEDYVDALKQILEKKSEQLADENIFVVRDRLSKYAIQKGYEQDLVWSLLKEMMPG